MKKITVFCASSPKIRNEYKEEARSLAEKLVSDDYEIVYGGGATGLMGAVADRAIELNGKVTGVIPHFMVEVEWEHKGVSKMIHVADMAERKKLLIKDTSAVIVLPGGTGTIEELFEVLSLKKLGQFHQPIILVNTCGFFDPLIQLMGIMVKENFMRPEHDEMYHVVDKASDVIEALKWIPEWSKDAIKFAAVK